MRLAPRLAVVCGAVAAVVLATAPTAAANPDPCPNGDSVCVYSAGPVYDVSHSIGQPPTGTTFGYVPGPTVCDSSGTNCTGSYVAVPGATIQLDPATLATVPLPAGGVGVTTLTIFTPSLGGLPTVGSAGVQVVIVSEESPVGVTLGARECEPAGPITVGTVTITDTGCAIVVTAAA